MRILPAAPVLFAALTLSASVHAQDASDGEAVFKKCAAAIEL